MNRSIFTILNSSCTLGLSIMALCWAGASSANVEAFENHIRPVLAENCFSCHDADKSEGQFKIHSKVSYAKGGTRSGMDMANVNKLVIQVLQNNTDFPHPTHILSNDEHANLLEWVRKGAIWPEPVKTAITATMAEYIDESRKVHWSYQPVKKPELPTVKNTAWVQSPIDTFILAKLEEAGLEASGVADPHSLLRRIYYDLIGLPPTYEQMQSFAQDPSLESVGKIIDELLASPQYGERWGRYWLDVARYSDTKGFGLAEDRYFPYPHTYRDYVIRAFNEDMPYDQFIIEQLAADKLELNDDPSALAALGFITLGRQFPGDRNATLDDQIDVVMRGFQGLTVSCARCHDHKFDAIPTADYYSIYGIFRSSHRPSQLPLLSKPDESDAGYMEYKMELDKREKALEDFTVSLHEKHLRGTRTQLAKYLQFTHEALDEDNHTTIRQHMRENEKDLTWNLVQRWLTFLKTNENKADPVFDPWWAYAQLDMATFAEKSPAVLNSLDKTGLSTTIVNHFKTNPPQSMAEVNEYYGTVLHGAHKEWQALLNSEDSDVAVPNALADPERELLRQALYGEKSPANIPASDAIGLSDIEDRKRINARRETIQTHMSTHPSRPDRAMVLADTSSLYNPYVFKRGKEGVRGEDVPRRFLAVLSNDDRSDYDDGSGRLHLAKAIASKDNPLTARIMVNRVWMHHFGQAIVDTPSDFGSQGSRPTHPELLDYLAWEFMEDGWSVKRLHKRIMMSSVYLQTSAETPEGMKADPDNKLLGHFQRRRLDFEAMRDSMLLASDKLDITMGGHSVDISKEPFPNRRTVYAEVDRQDLPAVFSTFDFAEPGAHSEKRFQTTVPQQSLYFMNNAFVAEQARTIAKKVVEEHESTDVRIQNLYRELLKREVKQRELVLGKSFVESMKDVPILKIEQPKSKSDWLYGYGTVDPVNGKTTTFTEFPYWSGEAYQGDANWPEGNLGYAQLTKRGGHPGDENHSVVRRWISPVNSTISMVGELYHYSSVGDGIKAYMISSREGIIWEGEVQDDMILTEFNDRSIQIGDTVDLVVVSNGESAEDRFRWHPRLFLSAEDATQYPKQDWLTRFDYEGPPPKLPKPLAAWEQYAQVLLMTNEFLFLD